MTISKKWNQQPVQPIQFGPKVDLINAFLEQPEKVPEWFSPELDREAAQYMWSVMGPQERATVTLYQHVKTSLVHFSSGKEIIVEKNGFTSVEFIPNIKAGDEI